MARLVDGVTKLNRLELQSPQTAQAENFRKLLLAMSEDIRVLLVKLADRLHNMRTLHFKPGKRRRIAAETMEIYAPLAERMGMEWSREADGGPRLSPAEPRGYAAVVERLTSCAIATRVIGEMEAELTTRFEHRRGRR